MTATRVHTHVTFADPNHLCDTCGAAVTGFHDPERCGCEGEWHNVPNCGHNGSTSACSSWSPVDGCRCEDHPHGDLATSEPGITA